MQLITIATKLIRLADQIIASLYLKYLYNQMISLEDMVSSSFVVFARNVLYLFFFLYSSLVLVIRRMGVLCVVSLVAWFCVFSSVNAVLYDVRPPECANVQVKQRKKKMKDQLNVPMYR